MDEIIRLTTPDDEKTVRLCVKEAYDQYVVAIGKPPAPMIADFAAQIVRNCVYVIEQVMVSGEFIFESY